VVAGALSGKGFLPCELDRKDEALAVCYEFLRYRFGEDNEPELRGMVEGILSAKNRPAGGEPPRLAPPHGICQTNHGTQHSRGTRSCQG
jgi:hypothetical protein